MPRPPNTEARRAQIVAALGRVMAKTGYERATIAAIAREAGLSPGLVHYHFRAKQEILLALVARLAGEVEARAEAACGSTPRERLLAWLDAHVGLGPGADPDAVACWVEIGAEALHQPEVAEVWRQVVAARLDDLTSRVREVRVAEGGCGPDDARDVAAALLAGIEGAWRLGSGAPDAMPRGFASRGLRAMLEGLLGRPPERGPAPVPFVKPPDDWAIWR